MIFWLDVDVYEYAKLSYAKLLDIRDLDELDVDVYEYAELSYACRTIRPKRSRWTRST